MTVLPMTKYIDVGGGPNRMSVAPRNVWFVDSAVDDSSGRTPETAFGTVEEATDKASAGDTVILMPYHLEVIATAAAWNPDVAGVKYISLGHGNSRARIQLSANLSTVEFDANDQWFENIIFEGTFATGTAVGLDIKTGCDDLMLKDCVIRGTAAADMLLKGVSIEATNDRITFDGCEFFEFATSTATTSVFTEGAFTNLKFKNCNWRGDWSVACLDLDAAAVTADALVCIDCHAINTDTTAGANFCRINNTTAAFFTRCDWHGRVANSIPVLLAEDGASSFVECYGCDAGGTWGLIWGGIATAWS